MAVGNYKSRKQQRGSAEDLIVDYMQRNNLSAPSETLECVEM
ncbi:hypothetical protein IMSAG249_01118 [Lachnospiraceae bacterium]|nr:hypothetical protein IMSAG249_01118 [Lachnospiraceae bacterium]